MSKVQQATGKAFEDAILEFLKSNNYFTLKMGTGRMGTVFDVLSIKHDKAFAFELKTVAKGGKLSYTQELVKKTDELNRYSRCNNNLYLLIDFKQHDICIITWRNALQLFKTQGFVMYYDCQNFKKWGEV